jgi:hypothetical protein
VKQRRDKQVGPIGDCFVHAGMLSAPFRKYGYLSEQLGHRSQAQSVLPSRDRKGAMVSRREDISETAC